MSGKLLWTGLTIILGIPAFESLNAFLIAGAIIMLIGVIAMWLNQ